MYDDLVKRIGDLTHTRSVVPHDSDYYVALCEEERALRSRLALTPEHRAAQRAWSAQKKVTRGNWTPPTISA